MLTKDEIFNLHWFGNTYQKETDYDVTISKTKIGYSMTFRNAIWKKLGNPVDNVNENNS